MKKYIEALRSKWAQTDKRALLIRVGFIVLCAAVLIGLVYLAFGQAAPELLPLLKNGDEEQIAAYLGSQNSITGIISTAVLAFLQPVSIILPGAPIQIAAGVVYGTLKGFLICHISYVFSNLVLFYLARVLGQKMDKFVFHFSDKANFLQDAQYPAYMTAMACLIPVIPNGIIPYAAARTKMRFHEFLIAVVLGSFFPILVMCAIGKRILRGEFIYAAVLLGFCLVVVIVLTLLRKQVVNLMHKVGQKILRWLSMADRPGASSDPEIPPLQDDLP